MSAANDNNPGRRGLRGWWASPPRSGARLVITPWEYRHLRGFAQLRVAGGIVAAILGLIVVAAAGNAWVIFGALLLLVALANFAFAYWELSIARSESA